ncbi:phospholipase [Burkholderia cepacia]|uniref:phospholipase D-like domain-containing protein n=1 Tax=Burkholderia cepacia TaxID=292 RepID=UPI00075F824B|nr:phosphatidylserine/phosphatidylglycerophosphate/cardiolipin synthase family protein [Burkholderia cepacia]KWE27541.1 phospholipase [Burkholderia cepacia]RQZ57223.1 phosphatidylserine/phosphatidylglycerophosphate/cardiolipin synthase family protein [Burkholderia cepacia]
MATPNQKITTPIAQNQTSAANVCLPWYVQNTEYGPKSGSFRPLVNGETAFRAVYDAIASAKHSIDIICWGFQPSMYFRRDGSGMRIGELLEKKGKEGLKVRLLCWHDDFYLAELSENNMPGFDGITKLKQSISQDTYDSHPLMAPDYQTADERKFDTEWYRRANLSNVTRSGSASIANRVVDDVVMFPVKVAQSLTSLSDAPTKFLHRKEAMANVEIATRGFSFSERAEIIGRIWNYGSKSDWNSTMKRGAAKGMGSEPTHHQKMVLIDYEDPELATGFVMGHNMLDQYWDTDDHHYDPKTPSTGRNGPFPWQDISSRVTGPILEDLNKNFCEAWDDATGQNLTKLRAGQGGKQKIRTDSADDLKVRAQVLRTQSQKGKRDIEKMYLQAVNNATQYIFIQNQYFRWQELATKIKNVAASHLRWGRDIGQDGPIYLFVITNSSDAAVGNGTVRTYQMLNSLGYGNSMPGVALLEREDGMTGQQKAVDDQLTAQQNSLLSQLSAEQASLQKIQSQGVNPFDGSAMQGVANYYQASQAQQQDIQIALDEVQRKKRANANIHPDAPPTEVPGLKIHICTLVAPDSHPDNWLPVYVHAKLMTVDDAFMTLGSANVNIRSMNVDSELNICHENSDVTKPLRRKLWGLHTKNQGAQDDVTSAFTGWTMVLGQNKINEDKGLAPFASLVKFTRASDSRTYDD